MGLFLGAGAVWSPSAHRAYLAFSGEVDRERAGEERERSSADACALIALTAAVYRRAECQSDHLQEQINTAQCVSHSHTHARAHTDTHRVTTHTFHLPYFLSSLTLDYLTLCELQSVLWKKVFV